MRRFRAADARLSYYAPTDFHEAKGGGTSGVAGSIGSTTFSSVLSIPHVVDDDDSFVWQLEYNRHGFWFPSLYYADAVSAERPPGPEAAFGAEPHRPFEQLQLLRVMWTWRKRLGSGYNLYLHNRTGFHGDQLRVDGRWARVGIASAFEKVFSPSHSLGAGLIALMGIGELDPIPFLRYRFVADPVRIAALLPLHAHVFSRVGQRAELGFVLEADGNRYRIDRETVPFDRVDFIYSYWGPSLRVELFRDVFVRGDVGFSGVRVLDMHYDDAQVSILELGQSPLTALNLSFEPGY